MIGFQPSTEQRELQRLAREFAERELRPISREWDEREDFPPELLAKAAAAGLTSYAIPTEYGGGGVDAVSAALVAEELSWGCAGLAATIQATMFPVQPLVQAGTAEQKDRYLRRLASTDGALSAIGFTEAHAGTDLAAMRTTARRDGGDWVLNGEKCYLTNGGIAELTVVFAKVDERIAAFLVQRGDPGVSAGRKERKLGLRASYTGSLVLADARLPADRLLGEEGQGWELALDFFQASRPQVAAAAVGLAQAAFEQAAAYAAERQAFGRPLTARQGVSFKLADMGMEIEAARLLVWRACETLDRGEDASLLGSYAKAYAADVAMRVTTEAVQVLGGAGVMRDHLVEKWFRDAKVFQIVEGTSEIQREIAARRIGAFTGQPRG